VEVANLPIVEDVAHRQLVEDVLIVQDLLLESTDVVFVPFCRDGSIGLSVGNSLEQPIGNTLEQGHVKVRLYLERGLDDAWGKGD
jgi:hypothetical protein